MKDWQIAGHHGLQCVAATIVIVFSVRLTSTNPVFSSLENKPNCEQAKPSMPQHGSNYSSQTNWLWGQMYSGTKAKDVLWVSQELNKTYESI